MAVYENGEFRRYHMDESKPTPLPGQDVLYILDKKVASRAYWWALLGVPTQKLLVDTGCIKTAKVVAFHQDRRFGFLEAPAGEEDVFIHLNECHEYRDGTFQALTTEVRGPCEGSIVAFLRNPQGRVVKWGIVNIRQLMMAKPA